MNIFPSSSISIPPKGPAQFPPLGTRYLDMVLSVLGLSVIQYLPGDDASGTTAVDAGPLAINGAYTGTVALGAAGIGDGKTAVNLNATGAVNAYKAALVPHWSESVGCAMWWAKMNNVSFWLDGNSYSAMQVNADATHYYHVRKNNATTFVLFSRRAATIKSVTIDPPASARWCHYALAWDTPNDTLTAYINGSKQIQTTGLGSILGTGIVTDYFGCNVNVDVFWPGTMAHMIQINAVPTASQIAIVAQPLGQTVFEGDSRSTLKLWPSQATELAFPSGEFCYGRYGYSSQAVSGSTTTTMLARQAAINSMIMQGKTNIIVVWCGVNDALILTAAQIYANLATYCASARAAGYKVILCTEIDAAPAGWTTKYQALNTLIYADHSFADELADLGAQSELQDHTNPTYFVDGTHLTTAGYNIVRDVVYPVIAQVATL